MSLPNIIKDTQIKISAIPLKKTAEVTTGARLSRERLTNEFRMNPPHDLRDYWCWAIVAEGISLYHPKPDPVSQCDIAAVLFPDRECCSSHKECDETKELDEALKATGNYASGPEGPAGFWAIDAQLQDDKPVCCRIGDAYSGHYVVIIDTYVLNGTEFVSFLDPYYDRGPDPPYESFIASCSDTYFTLK